MNYSDDFKFKNYFSSRNRSLTKDQKSILDFYQEKISLESFSKLDQINEYKNISLEIGFGAGDILLHNALNFPNNLFVGVEYYKKGIAQLLLNIEKHNLKNVRLFYGDALDYLKLAKTNYLDEILIMFPDPWPKRRHWKRRIINKDSVNEISRILRSNGRALFFTDNKGIAYWGLRHFILNADFNWEIDMPINCRNKISTYPVSRYEQKALKNNTNPFYFQFIKQ
jgi:tRNA (guanine-N7-)-methyltransferase